MAKSIQLSVIINKPTDFVFEFVINPKNTPKWIDGILKEETNEWPVKLGTVYRNQNSEGEWHSYKITEFDRSKSFVMSQLERNYNVSYTLTSDGKNRCKLEYYEWTDRAELEVPFTQDILEKLKKVIETEN